MSREELIGLAVVCHWRLTAGGYLERGLVTIYPGDAEPDGNQTVNLWDSRQGYPGKQLHCHLSELRSVNRPWIIGPFSGKFFSLKTQRIWG